MAENLAKREAYMEIMEDLRVHGHVELHLKYMEKYDSLKAEYKELEAQLNVSAAA
mgnify:FL=1